MFQQFLREEDGQTTVEYLLIIAVIVVTISVLGKNMQKQVGDLVNKIFANVNKSIDNLMKGAVQ